MSSTRNTHLAALPAHRDLYYGGEWHRPAAGGYRATLDPAYGIALAEVAEAQADDVDAAVRAAQQGFEVWRRMKPLARANIMREAAAIRSTRGIPSPR